MVIAMSQITQVARGGPAAVHREFSTFFARRRAAHPSEHWQVAHSETSHQRVRRTAFLVVCVLAVSCNVYDASLLDSSLLLNGGGGGAGGPITPGDGGMNAGGAVNVSGSSDISDAGASRSLGGSNTGGGSTGGGSTGGGSTGGGSTGGVSGAATEGGATTGGAPTGSTAGASVNPIYSVIDDMEMPDPNIPNTDSRAGFWSIVNDGTGMQVPATMTMSPIPGGREASSYALHTTTTGFKAGPQVGVDLNRKGSTRSSFDASLYKGVHFWAKVGNPSSKDVHFSIPDQHTDPGGGLCCESLEMCNGTANIAKGLCYDHFATDLKFSTAWAEYTVLFTALNQVGWGDNKESGKAVEALDASHVFNVQFNWGTAEMDLWVDDISFVRK